MFDGRETFNHGTWVPLDKRRILADHGVRVNVCPRIETQFRFGQIPYQDWLDVGIRPGLSNDNPTTYAISMFSEMRTLYAYQRAKHHRDAIAELPHLPKLVTQRDMLESATLGGAENCALEHKVGSLTPGKQADLVILDTANVDLTPVNNAFCTVVQSGDGGYVEAVFVAGRVVKWEGRLVGYDLERIRTMVNESRDHLYAQANWPHPTVDFDD